MVSMRMTPVLLKTHDPIWHLLVKFTGYFYEKKYGKFVIEAHLWSLLKRTCFPGRPHSFNFIMSFIMKSLVIIVFFASSVASQKCKKPKVGEMNTIMISFNFNLDLKRGKWATPTQTICPHVMSLSALLCQRRRRPGLNFLLCEIPILLMLNVDVE